MIRNLYIASVALAGIVLFALTLPGLPLEAWLSIVLLGVLCGAAQLAPVPLFRSSSISLAMAFVFCGLLLFGPAAAIAIHMANMLVHAVYPKRRPLHKTAFNLGLAGLAAGGSGTIYLASGGQVPIENYLASVLPMGAAALCYFLVQTVGVTVAILLSEGGSFRKIWQSNYYWLLASTLAVAGISMGMALAYRGVGELGMLSFSLPLGMAWYLFRLYMSNSKEVRAQNALLQGTVGQLEESFGSIMRALAIAAATKDQYTHDRPGAAMRYAAETARRLGLDASSTAAVQVGALLHDIGKMSIPDSTLRKPTVLSDGEWESIRQHPILGAQMLQQVAALKDVELAILHHHERFDGQGYPDKLQGEQIPLTAQIVAVVDAYLAMTSDRPYRPALSPEQAVSELRRHGGTQFNPDVVEAFVAVQEAAAPAMDDWPQVDLSLLLRSRPLGVAAVPA